eukprot:gene21583-28581_t
MGYTSGEGDEDDDAEEEVEVGVEERKEEEERKTVNKEQPKGNTTAPARAVQPKIACPVCNLKFKVVGLQRLLASKATSWEVTAYCCNGDMSDDGGDMDLAFRWNDDGLDADSFGEDPYGEDPYREDPYNVEPDDPVVHDFARHVNGSHTSFRQGAFSFGDSYDLPVVDPGDPVVGPDDPDDPDDPVVYHFGKHVHGLHTTFCQGSNPWGAGGKQFYNWSSDEDEFTDCDREKCGEDHQKVIGRMVLLAALHVEEGSEPAGGWPLRYSTALKTQQDMRCLAWLEPERRTERIWGVAAPADVSEM